jgi:DNA-binding HxlR family transcriptional regulator
MIAEQLDRTVAQCSLLRVLGDGETWEGWRIDADPRTFDTWHPVLRAALRDLEIEGLVEVVHESTDRRYRLTPAGMNAATRLGAIR